MLAILLGGGIALLISLLGTRVAIRVFTRRGYGQEIRDDGPTSHHTKRGTPTMGGVVIIAAVVLSFGLMLFSSKYIFAFVNKHPSVKLLALAFLVMIGVFLIVDGFGIKVDKALIYVPMAFAVGVEALNLIYRARQRKRAGDTDPVVELHHPYSYGDDSAANAAAIGETDGSVGLSAKPVSTTPSDASRSGASTR